MSLHFPYRPGAVLTVQGEDSGNFLQGQFTNELRMTAGGAVYGLFLNQKGKVVADAHVLKRADNDWLITSVASPAEVVRKRLEDYIIADDVVVKDESPAMWAVAVWGADAAGQLAQINGSLPPDGGFGRQGDAFVFAGRRMKAESFEVIGPEKSISEIRQKLAALDSIEAAPNEVEFLRITDGIPTIPRDIGAGDLPNEAALDETAISFTKGCYLGQEVMARLKNMGQVRRRLTVLRGRGRAPATGAAVYQGAKKFGEIRSVAGKGGDWAALAMLSLVNLDNAAGVSLAPGAPATARITP